jgi:hypothetical protein
MKTNYHGDAEGKLIVTKNFLEIIVALSLKV